MFTSRAKSVTESIDPRHRHLKCIRRLLFHFFVSNDYWFGYRYQVMIWTRRGRAVLLTIVFIPGGSVYRTRGLSIQNTMQSRSKFGVVSRWAYLNYADKYVLKAAELGPAWWNMTSALVEYVGDRDWQNVFKYEQHNSRDQVETALEKPIYYLEHSTVVSSWIGWKLPVLICIMMRWVPVPWYQDRNV